MRPGRLTSLIFVTVLSTGMLLLAPSCSKESRSDKSGVQDVEFLAGAPEALTRAVYDYLTGSGPGSKTAINWESGDEIRIFYPQSTATPKYADYVLTPTAGDLTRATISCKGGGEGLQWNKASGSHTFYALYPAPSASLGGGIDGNGFSIKVAASQPVREKTIASDTTFIHPSLPQGGWMYAMNSATNSNSSVDLGFRSCYTAFTVVLNSGSNNNITINSFTLSSSKLGLGGVGTFPHVSTPADAMAMTAATDTSRSVKVDLTGNEVALPRNGNIVFTVFALPQTYGTAEDCLTLEFGTSIGTRRLRLESSGTPLAFPPFVKYNIRGLTLPQAGLELDMGDNIIWDNSIDITVLDNINWDSGVLDGSVPDWIRWKNVD